MQKFSEWLKENYDDGTDLLEFNSQVQAPLSLVFQVYKENKEILDGVAIAYPPKKIIRNDFSYFYIKCPKIGLSEFTTMNNLNSPIGNFIKDHVLMKWDFTTKRFKND